MELVVDANIIFAALIREGMTAVLLVVTSEKKTEATQYSPVVRLPGLMVNSFWRVSLVVEMLRRAYTILLLRKTSNQVCRETLS